jgi:hypothetical protein
MKIGLFGDSFGVQCRDRPYKSWVDLLADQHGIKNYCECGVSEYKILKQLTSTDLAQFDQIIITHTSPTRVYVKYNPLHCDSEYHKNCDIIYADIESHTDEFSTAGQLYFKHIFDLDYAVDIHNLICKKIDEVCHNQNVLHITHFDYSKLYPFKNLQSFYKLFLKHRGNVNHYTEEGNKKVYQEITKLL